MIERLFRLIKPGTRQQMVCFHHAGGSAEYFLPWKTDLPPDTALYAIQLPGHGGRINESLLHNLHQMADVIAQSYVYLPARDTFFFGHSMGAALAFEVALRLQKAGRGITTLYVSGRLPPHKNTNTDFYRQSDVSILNKVTQLGGSALDYQQPELKDLLLPIFRADFTAIETYQRQCTELLNCSVMACVGEQDTEVSVRQMSEWCQVTKGAFRLQVFPGGHFYLNHAQKRLLAFINQSVAAQKSSKECKEYHDEI
ncbi:thioesterase II family protein [Yersinia wautersii]|uniref:Thioesterase n=1 Tax=Yersinia wautersii TaxID=1341643 RepID=A0ABP1ZJH1_9GAMM|nr:thioesterase II family protein [Yersinia wautersii]CRG51693.1 thioesterase [Yersinia wautersii]